jgi:nickel-type superoxide dismutase maturation protease
MRWPLRRVLVSGTSMSPTLRPEDQLLVWLRTPRRPRAGRVVVVALPDRPLSVKRVQLVGPDGRVWVAGDNPAASTDSRQLGWLASSSIAGTVCCRYWPRPGRIAGPPIG